MRKPLAGLDPTQRRLLAGSIHAARAGVPGMFVREAAFRKPILVQLTLSPVLVRVREISRMQVHLACGADTFR